MAANLIITFAEASGTHTGFLPNPQDPVYLCQQGGSLPTAHIPALSERARAHTHTHTHSHTHTHLRPQIQVLPDNKSRGLAGALQLDGDA